MTRHGTLSELSLTQAARVTGKSKSTINRAIKSGKLSAMRHEDGSYSIDGSELSRAFRIEPASGSKWVDAAPQWNQPEPPRWKPKTLPCGPHLHESARRWTISGQTGTHGSNRPQRFWPRRRSAGAGGRGDDQEGDNMSRNKVDELTRHAVAELQKLAKDQGFKRLPDEKAFMDELSGEDDGPGSSCAAASRR